MPLMDVGFATSGECVRTLPASWPFLLSARAGSGFFQAPPRGGCYFTVALHYHFTSITL